MAEAKSYERGRGPVPAKMSAVVCTGYAGYKDFDVGKLTFNKDPTEAVPAPQDGEVLVRVLASSVNPIDWKILSGALQAQMPVGFPIIPGFDASGVVAAVGAGVDRLKVGDAVWTDVVRVTAAGLRLGAFAQYVSVPQTKVALAPNNLTAVQAATLPLAALTSLQCLQRVKAQKGQNILILGASGGTGTAAVQIAKQLGCHVTATCSGKNAELVKSLGADVIVNYREQKWQDEVKNADAVLDLVGEPGACQNGNNVLKDGGHFVTIASHDAGTHKWERGVTGSFLLTNSESVADLDTLKGYVESGSLKPIVAKVFPLAEIAGVFQASLSGRTVGKVAVEIP